MNFIVKYKSKWHRAVWEKAGVYKPDIALKLDSGDIIAYTPQEMIVDVPIKEGVLSIGDNVLAPFKLDSYGKPVYHYSKVISEGGQWYYKLLSGEYLYQVDCLFNEINVFV